MLKKALLLMRICQLIYMLHLWSIEPALPLTCKSLYLTLKQAPLTITARYLLNRSGSPRSLDLAGLVTKVLTYPICSQAVLETLLRIIPDSRRYLFPRSIPRNPSSPLKISTRPVRFFKLPRRLFRDVATSNQTLMDYLQYLFNLPPVRDTTANIEQAMRPDPNSHDGYPLIRAVQAHSENLVQFLLLHKADPNKRDKLAILVAIGHRDLQLVKLLVTEDKPHGHRLKKDRVTVDNIMLARAVSAGATEIVEWLVKDKGCVPDIKTLRTFQ